jgi:Fe-S cluster assembly scaffold protein SufB
MARVKSSKGIREKAEAAANKPAAVGEDIDLAGYDSSAEEPPYQADPAALPAEAKERMLKAGVSLDDTSQRSGTFVQTDNTPIHASISQEGVEVMATSQALKKYDWLSDYWWRAVAVDTDKYTAQVELSQSDGYFIRTLPGSKTEFPVQACLYLAKSKLAQKVHNIIIAEEGSELHIITGCTTASEKDLGLHLGVSEFYVKKGARVSFTMIHSWAPEIAVRPRTGIIVEDEGVFLSNYVIMQPVHSVQTYPVATCVGENATVRFNSVMVARAGATMDVGSKAILNGKGSRTETISRAIASGGNIFARGYIEGNAPEVKGHLECRGLILTGGMVHAIPELKGTLAGIDLSHEAAVGKIAEEEVEYLMARGLTRDEATATIVRGFLRVDIEGLPPLLAEELQRAVETSESEAM